MLQTREGTTLCLKVLKLLQEDLRGPLKVALPRAAQAEGLAEPWVQCTTDPCGVCALLWGPLPTQLCSWALLGPRGQTGPFSQCAGP